MWLSCLRLQRLKNIYSKRIKAGLQGNGFIQAAILKVVLLFIARNSLLIHNKIEHMSSVDL